MVTYTIIIIPSLYLLGKLAQHKRRRNAKPKGVHGNIPI
jgi:hypothetical protein